MCNSATSVQFITPAAARVTPFAVFIAFVILQGLAGEWLRSAGLDPRWLYAARTIVVALLLAAFWRHYRELHSYAGITSLQILVAIGAGMAVFLLWINLDFTWATFGTSVAFDPGSPDGSGLDKGLIFFRLIGLGLVVPVMEELFWRSYLLRRIDRWNFLAQDPGKASLFAILLSTLLFTLAHTLWLASLIAGLVYIFVYMRSGNLWLPIISHATTNIALGCWILATGNWQFW